MRHVGLPIEVSGDTGDCVPQWRIKALIAEAVRNPGNAWSIGTFGVIGEFMRTASEAARIVETDSAVEVTTARGAMRIVTSSECQPVAYQSPWVDGETWSSAVAFCLRSAHVSAGGGFRQIGVDLEALRPEDADAMLLDLGVGIGGVAMFIRTRDTEILEASRRMEDQDLLGGQGVEFIKLLQAKSPVRVLVSPMGRIEVYLPIPVSGQSPLGPHTHLLPSLARLRRTHSANIPIPESSRPVLTLHPRSPWRNMDGERVNYDRTAARDFDELFAEFGTKDALDTHRAIEAAVLSGQSPDKFAFPTKRRLRLQARVTLRRLALDGKSANVVSWLSMYDRPSMLSSTP